MCAAQILCGALGLYERSSSQLCLLLLVAFCCRLSPKVQLLLCACLRCLCVR